MPPHLSDSAAEAIRVEHEWELKKTTGKAVPFLWVCSRCHAEIPRTKEHVASGVCKKPNRKRKIEGLYCGERMILEIHES